MDKNATYAAVSAKVHAMMGEFLTEEDYKIFKFKNTFRNCNLS